MMALKSFCTICERFGAKRFPAIDHCLSTSDAEPRTKSALIYLSPWSLNIYDSIKIVSLTRSGPNLNCLSPYTNFLNRSSITHTREQDS
ncbi:unnamed protein product [Cylindrotheca closterium]|uniref:Uncharacterized protein n=1 Tax=Cylindrotheca closterium TaxID=2856 RepID=A0AAD2GD21_9STRA|nr:unnamed protein product [Cylindrotheca closterium]